MTIRPYSKAIAVRATPAAVYRALTAEHASWWTYNNGTFASVGDRVRFTFKPQASYWTLEARKLVPSEAVELVCVEAHHVLLDLPNVSKTEWLGTRMIWYIEARDRNTHIHFEHQGLTPDLHCYHVCEVGWDTFFERSLASYLDTGVGVPFGQAAA
ncbi:MAG: SRPBCC domain-containing protein [Pseudomonadota bacterium]